MGFALALLIVSAGCHRNLDREAARKLIVQSAAFHGPSASGDVPVFDRVRAVMKSGSGLPSSGFENTVLIWFEYHWEDCRGRRLTKTLQANVFARRVHRAWRIDEEITRRLVPDWPVLPRNPLKYSIR